MQRIGNKKNPKQNPPKKKKTKKKKKKKKNNHQKKKKKKKKQKREEGNFEGKSLQSGRKEGRGEWESLPSELPREAGRPSKVKRGETSLGGRHQKYLLREELVRKGGGR